MAFAKSSSMPTAAVRPRGRLGCPLALLATRLLSLRTAPQILQIQPTCRPRRTSPKPRNVAAGRNMANTTIPAAVMALGRTNLFCVKYLHCSHSSLNQIYRPQFPEASGTAEHTICSASTCNYASPTHLLTSSHENTGGAACRGPILFSTLPAIMMLFRCGLTPIHFSKIQKKHRADQCPGSQIEILKTTTKSITQTPVVESRAHAKGPKKSTNLQSQRDHPSFNCFALAEREAWPEGPAHELLSPSLLQPQFNINT